MEKICFKLQHFETIDTGDNVINLCRKCVSFWSRNIAVTENWTKGRGSFRDQTLLLGLRGTWYKYQEGTI